VDSAIANCFPGLEFDFRAVWKHLFEGVELHESNNLVVAVEPGSAAAQSGVVPGLFLLAVSDPVTEHLTEVPVTGPRQPNGPLETLALTNLEWTNAVSALSALGGETVTCRFRGTDNTELPPISLRVRPLFDGVALALAAAEPGALTQGLCSPWQADYRECACYYWAASRPDFVNAEVSQGQASGHNWMLKNRTAATPRVYTRDVPTDPAQLSYDDLYRGWEPALRFILGGRDEG
jgi:hypothetical protein